MAENLVKKSVSQSVTRYYGHLSSCIISEKTNDSILRKLSDEQTDRWMEEQTRWQRDRGADGRERFHGCCPTNVDCPIETFFKTANKNRHI